MEIMKPVININGTSAEELVLARMNARTAIEELMKEIGETRPHARDYAGDKDAYERDLKIYQERFKMIDALYNVLMDEALDIQDRADPEPEEEDNFVPRF